MGRTRKLLKPRLEGKYAVVRFLHPVLNRTVRVNLGAHGQEADDNLKTLNRIFLDEDLWRSPPDDLPETVRRAWLGPVAGVVLENESTTVNGEPLTINADEMARIAADKLRLENETRLLRAETIKLRRQLEDALGRKIRAGPCPTLKEAYIEWLESYKGRSSHYVCIVNSILKMFVNQFGGNIPVDQLEGKEPQINAWIQGMTIKYGKRKGSRVGPEHRKRVRKVVLQFLEGVGISLKRKVISSASIAEVRNERGRIRWLERAQAEAIAETLPEYWSRLFQVQVGIGLRPNELITLKKGDFSENLATLTLSPLLHLRLKTGSRHIQVPTALRDTIKNLLERSPIVFPDPDTGEPWKNAVKFNRKYNFALNQAGKKIGVPFRLDCRVGRRTCASLLIRTGMDVESISAILGNSPTMIREHYGRILPVEVDPSAAVLSTRMIEEHPAMEQERLSI